MTRRNSIEVLKRRLRRTLWLPILVMAVIVLSAFAALLYREQLGQAHADIASLEALLTSQRALIAQEVFLAQDEAVKLRLKSLLSDWQNRSTRNSACIELIFPETSKKVFTVCSRDGVLEAPQWRDRVLTREISVDGQVLATVRAGLITHLTLTDLLPPLLVFAVLAAALLAAALYSILVKRIERTVLTPVIEKLSQEQRNAAVAQTARMVAHDIRRPFQLVQLALLRLECADDEKVRTLGKQLKADLETTTRSVESMLNDILDIERDFKPDLRPVALDRVGEWLKQTLRGLYPDATTNYSIFLPHDLVALADNAQLTRVLLNLTENALQAMEKKGRLQIAARPISDWIEFSVSNDGPLIPKEDWEKVFQPVFTTRKAGTGLGLAIAKRIVEQHGGRLWVDSSDEEVTCFKFTLRRYAGVVETSQSNSQTLLPEFGNSSVLIFDDQQLFREAWTAWAEEGTTNIHSFSNWEEFVAKNTPAIAADAVAFVDVHFEKSTYDGIDIARNLRQLGARKLIAITSDPRAASDSKLFDAVIGKLPKGKQV